MTGILNGSREKVEITSKERQLEIFYPAKIEAREQGDYHSSEKTIALANLPFKSKGETQ